ncbi:hypothetical protein QYF36_015788 [Acer negundo]|nr:hypothetical protein QYF36_015788 [Acer negundo]
MSLNKFSWEVVLPCLVLTLVFFFKVHGDSEVSVKFLKSPHSFSRLNSATFLFEVSVGGNGTCTDCSFSCKLDDDIASDCGAREVSYTGLSDGNHTFEVCSNGSSGVGCSSYNWIVDTVPPTACVTASSSLTNELNVSVNISFTESCTGGGGFGCSSVNACNLIVYGDGQVIPPSLITLQPGLRYSLLVGLSSMVQYGRAVLVMDKSFCTDNAGNKFTGMENSSFVVHFDRRSVFANVRSHVPEKLLQLNSETRTVQATNNHEHLKVFLYFSEPVLNTSADILNSLNTSQGALLPVEGKSRGNRRFGFMITNISNIAIITISLNPKSIISRYGTLVSPIEPATFLYDSQRPAVRLSTTSSTRTRQHNIAISIKFLKPVFGFNSTFISVSGGHLQSFQEISRSIYITEIKVDNDIVYVNVPENVTGDVAGNKSLPSNVPQVRHYSVPVISCVISAFVTAVFWATSLLRGCSPCQLQVFYLLKHFQVTLPDEYYEFTRGLQRSIPYFNLPWETGHIQPVMLLLYMDHHLLQWNEDYSLRAKILNLKQIIWVCTILTVGRILTEACSG